MVGEYLCSFHDGQRQAQQSALSSVDFFTARNFGCDTEPGISAAADIDDTFGGMSPSYILFGIVWHGDIWHLNYIINYVWSGVMAFIFLLSWQDNRLRPWVAFVVGLLTGWWHEGFSVPLLMAAAISFAVFDRNRTRRNVVMAIGLICGILILFMSPGALGRMGDTGLLPSLMDFVAVLKYDYVSVVFFLVVAVTMCIPSARRRMNMNVLLMLLVCSMAALCIHARININLRVGWFGQLTSLTGIYICLLALQPLLSGKKFIRCTCKSVVWGLSVLWAVHIVAVVVHTVEMRITFDKVYAKYKAEPEKVHFAKIKTEKDAWLITLMRPCYDEYTSIWCTKFIDRNTNSFPDEPWKVDDRSKYMLVVPEQLRDVRAQSGVSVKGTPGLRCYDGYYFISADSVAFNSERLFADCRIVFGDKDAILRSFTYTRFTSEADSRDYYWIYLNDSYLRSLFNPIIEVHLVE